MPRRDLAALFLASTFAFGGVAAWYMRTFNPVFLPAVDDDRIAAAITAEPGAWLVHGHAPNEQRFSSLTQISRESVSKLSVAWQVSLGASGSLRGTPLMIDDALYFADSRGSIYSLDAQSGETLWRFHPEAQGAAAACCGVAFYGRRVLVGTPGGRLASLERASGRVDWQTAPLRDASGRALAVVGAPRVGDGRIYMALAVPNAAGSGEVHAYDADDGELVWRRSAAADGPSAPLPAAAGEGAGAQDFPPQSCGALAGGALAHDPQLRQLYFSVGCAERERQSDRSPGEERAWARSAIVAVGAADGALRWRLPAPATAQRRGPAPALMLADAPVDGAARRLLLEVSANGSCRVIDRERGAALRVHRCADGVPLARAAAFDAARGSMYFSFVAASPAADSEHRAHGPRNTLTAFDPIAGRTRWSAFASAADGGGALATAGGLVFQGDAAGALSALDADTGALQWRYDAAGAMLAAPITYAVDGEQYLAVLVSGATSSEKGRLLAFALDAEQK